MRREGLTVTMIFLAESANYGEGVGNIGTIRRLMRKAVWYSLRRLPQ